MINIEQELLTHATKAVNNSCWHEIAHTTHWTPLTNDAQCLQLARQLGINIDYDTDKCAYKRANGQMYQEYFAQNCECWWPNDKWAVVAVAARLGGWKGEL